MRSAAALVTLCLVANGCARSCGCAATTPSNAVMSHDGATAAAGSEAAGASRLAEIVHRVAESKLTEALGPGRNDDFERASDEVWSLVEQAAARAIAAGGVTADRIGAAVEALNASGGGRVPEGFEVHAHALELTGSGAWAVTAEWGWASTFMVVGPTARWRVRDAARELPTRHDELVRWAYTAPGIHDGPFAGELLALPKGRDGRPRFLVDAVSRPGMGDNSPAQVSLWTWTGTAAVPLFFGLYETSSEAHAVRVEGSLVSVRVNADFGGWIVCGSCVAPQATWRLEVADGVIDRGRVPDQPELLLAGDLVRRACAHEDTSGLASAPARAALRRWLDQIDCSPGIYAESALATHEGRRELRVVGDEGAVVFSLVEREGKPWVASFTAEARHP